VQTIERGVAVDALHDEFVLNEDGSLRRRRNDESSASLCRGDRYLRVRVGGRLFLTHRVVFAMTHGRWPDGQLDHIDRNKLNNRPCNLREVDASTNCKNKDWGAVALAHAANFQARKISSNNTTGVRGVTKKGNRFVGQINVFGRPVRLGSHADLELVALIRNESERIMTMQPWRLLRCA
jgi:hypothetical protein